MKKSSLSIKPNTLKIKDLKPISKSDLKNSLSARAIDTKMLFKSDKIKEYSKFITNEYSRDISHIKDKFSSQLLKPSPTLPIDFAHLSQLYHSSDHFGMPISLSLNNLSSSHTCKKQACIEKAISTHNLAEIPPEDFNPDLFDRINLGNPTSRQDIKHLQQ